MPRSDTECRVLARVAVQGSARRRGMEVFAVVTAEGFEVTWDDVRDAFLDHYDHVTPSGGSAGTRARARVSRRLGPCGV